MEKVLRSQVHEVFSRDVRIELELISRRRDIRNKEKQEEIIKLLQANSINDFVKLGPGTNRYSLKLNGYVFKFATDNDGKIDNWKEFKVTKMFFPRFTKTHEVTTNGTILVSEYISPYLSYGEMLEHADDIRAILGEISQGGYLIGDVGISANNFANWGSRIGSSKPVCLDYAYIYEVTSNVFRCRNPKCTGSSILVPNSDYTYLVCPKCKDKKEFSDLRGLISYEDHLKEIGNLADEGYLMSSPTMVTELVEQRSNYLVKMRPKKKKEEVEKVIEPEVEETPQEVNEGSNDIHINKEGINMNIQEILANTKVFAANIAEKGGEVNGGLKISTISSITPVVTANPAQPEATIHVDNPTGAANSPIKLEPDTKMPTDKETGNPVSTIAFSGKVDDVPKHYPQAPVQQVDQDHDDNHNHGVVIDKKWDDDAIGEFLLMYEREGVKAAAAHFNIQESTAQKYYKKWKVEEPDLVAFRDVAYDAVCKLASRIYWDLQEKNYFDQMKSYITDRNMYPETFYKNVRTIVRHSLCDFLGWDEVHGVPNDNNEGTHMEYEPPAELGGEKTDPTLVFIKNLWYNKDIIKSTSLDEVTDIYTDAFDTPWGIQRDWLPILRERLNRRLIGVSKVGIQNIIDDIAFSWCSDDVPDISGSYQMNESMIREEEPAEDYFEDDAGDEELQDEGEETGNEDEEENMINYISVGIFTDDKYGYDVINVISEDQYAEIGIPIYTKLDEVTVTNEDTSIIDPRNGIWDWLTNFAPDVIFKTQDPQRWLDSNDWIPEDQGMTKYVILDSEDGWYTMGIFYVESICVVNQDNTYTPVTNPDLIAKINKLISQNMGFSNMSHLQRTLAMDDLVRTEEYVLSMTYEVEMEDGDDDGDDEEEIEVVGTSDSMKGVAEDMTEEATTTMDDLSAAAEAALMNNSAPEPEDEVVEETVEPEGDKQPIQEDLQEETEGVLADGKDPEETEVEEATIQEEVLVPKRRAKGGRTQQKLADEEDLDIPEEMKADLPPIKNVGGTHEQKKKSSSERDDSNDLTPVRRPRRGRGVN